jgi:hypothetical protein
MHFRRPLAAPPIDPQTPCRSRGRYGFMRDDLREIYGARRALLVTSFEIECSMNRVISQTCPRNSFVSRKCQEATSMTNAQTILSKLPSGRVSPLQTPLLSSLRTPSSQLVCTAARRGIEHGDRAAAFRGAARAAEPLPAPEDHSKDRAAAFVVEDFVLPSHTAAPHHSPLGLHTKGASTTARRNPRARTMPPASIAQFGWSPCPKFNSSRDSAPEGIDRSPPRSRARCPAAYPRPKTSTSLEPVHQKALNTARRGPKHGPCRCFGGAVRAAEPPLPRVTTLFKRLRTADGRFACPPARSRSPHGWLRARGQAPQRSQVTTLHLSP